MKPLSECFLYAFIDVAYLHGRAPEQLAEELCEGGADLIQLRAKHSSPEDILGMAQRILPILKASGVGLVINDHVSIAKQIGADLCHLGQEDFFEAGHRKATDAIGAGAGPLLGLSTHSPEQARRAMDAAPAYIAIGPVYATGTKPTARPVTLDYVRWAAANVSLPWFAIGGITLENLDHVLAAGARRICVVSAILNSTDLAATCRKFKERIRSHG
jgi:thiamine-phosphate pyrophosphorylase